MPVPTTWGLGHITTDVEEKSVGKEIVKLAIFDREGVSLALFREFTERGKDSQLIFGPSKQDS